MSLAWYGDQILKRIETNIIVAMNETVEQAALGAQILAPRDTGWLEQNIDWKPAQKSGGGYVATFGAEGVEYAIYVEEGTYKMVAQPYLRPAALDEFPLLASRIAGL